MPRLAGFEPRRPSPGANEENGVTRGRLQLWSYNYDPEPTGVAPVSTLLASLLRERGWEVGVVAAHPHYPEPQWGRCFRPYRETRDGITVLRLPLWVGRATAGQRLRQEGSFTASLMAALPLLGRPDVMVVTSPSFPALAAAILNAKLRRLRWVLWLHDVLPDGAVATGLLEEGSLVLRGSRRLEAAAYRSSDRIAVLSASFAAQLRSRGVPKEKIELIYDPATRGMPDLTSGPEGERRPRILSMGNIGHTQGLAPLVAAFERADEMRACGAMLVITGNGVAAEDVRREIRSERTRMLGIVEDERLEEELRSATMAMVSQSYEGTEFNLPSKLMNFMAYGLPILAAVNPGGEVARIVREAEAGWVVDSSEPDALPRAIAEAHVDPAELRRRAIASRRYAEKHFSPEAFGDSFDALLCSLSPVGPYAATRPAS